VPDHLSGLGRRDVVQVAIDPVDILVLKEFGDAFQNPVMGKKVIRVHETDHVPRRPGNPIVDRVVNAAVRF
jgi:hypothetical protein